MENINEKELMYLHDIILWQNLLDKKYKYYSNICDDPQLKAECEQFAAKQRKHFDSLIECI